MQVSFAPHTLLIQVIHVIKLNISSERPRSLLLLYKINGARNY